MGLTVHAGASELFLDPIFEVEVQEDIIFGVGSVGNPGSGELPLALDLYSPVGVQFDKPGMLLLYGGGFMERHPDQLRPLAEEFASQRLVRGDRGLSHHDG